MADPRRDEVTPEKSPDPAERVTARNYPNWIIIGAIIVAALIILFFFA